MTPLTCTTPSPAVNGAPTPAQMLSWEMRTLTEEEIRYRCEWNHGKRVYATAGELINEFRFVICGAYQIMLDGKEVALRSVAGENWWMIIECKSEGSAKRLANKLLKRTRFCDHITERTKHEQQE